MFQLVGCRVIPWAKANLNHVAQSLIISSGNILRALIFLVVNGLSTRHMDYQMKLTIFSLTNLDSWKESAIMRL